MVGEHGTDEVNLEGKGVTLDVRVPVTEEGERAKRDGRRSVLVALRLNPHLHLVALDGAWHEQGGELCWQGLGHLQTSEVGAVLFSTVRRIERHLRRRGLLGIDEDGTDPDVPGDPETNLRAEPFGEARRRASGGAAGDGGSANLAASAVSGQTPPARPQWVSARRRASARC